MYFLNPFMSMTMTFLSSGKLIFHFQDLVRLFLIPRHMQNLDSEWSRMYSTCDATLVG